MALGAEQDRRQVDMTEPKKTEEEIEAERARTRRRRGEHDLGASIGEPPEASRPAYPVRPERMA